MADAQRRQQKTETLATLYVGKLRLERRNGAPKIFARAYLQGKSIVRTTGEPVKPATLKKDLDFVRLVLHHAHYIEKCLAELPEFPSFRGEAWEVVPSPRPFLDHEQWVKLRKLAKARITEADLNPRSKQQ